MSSPARSRRVQASQSVRTLRQVRLTTSLPTAPGEQRGQRALDPARVGPGQVSARDQRLHLPGHPGVAGQSGAAPFLRAAALGRHPRARHADLDRAKLNPEPALTGPVPVTASAPPRPARAGAAQGLRQLLLQQLLNEAAHPIPDACLDRVEPSLPGKYRRAASTAPVSPPRNCVGWPRATMSPRRSRCC